MEILLCTDGSDSSIQAADLVSQLGFAASSRIIVLGVSDRKTEVDKLNISMDVIEGKLSGKYSLARKIRYGDPTTEILGEVIDHPYDLVAVGGGSQLGLLHPKLGSTASNLARRLHTHFLVARNLTDRILKILVCAGAETPASGTMKLGGAWISNTIAQIGVLHVMPAQKNVSTDESKTMSGRKVLPESGNLSHKVILETAGRQLREAGVKNEIISHFRQGLIVDEVLLELASGGYDLLVIGSHYLPGQDRWQGTLLDDVTDQLLNRSTCSVLII